VVFGRPLDNCGSRFVNRALQLGRVECGNLTTPFSARSKLVIVRWVVLLATPAEDRPAQQSPRNPRAIIRKCLNGVTMCGRGEDKALRHPLRRRFFYFEKGDPLLRRFQGLPNCGPCWGNQRGFDAQSFAPGRLRSRGRPGTGKVIGSRQRRSRPAGPQGGATVWGAEQCRGLASGRNNGPVSNERLDHHPRFGKIWGGLHGAGLWAAG